MDKIESIDINDDWFYRYITPDMFYKFIKSGGIKSERILNQQNIKKGYNSLGWNGIDYISLSKKQDIERNSSYRSFSYGNYSLIIDTTKAIKTYCIPVPILIALFPIPIRFSIYRDEYQVKDFLPLENIVGIKLPEKRIQIYDKKIKELPYYLHVMEETDFYLPFLDIENSKKISYTKVKEYIEDNM